MLTDISCNVVNCWHYCAAGVESMLMWSNFRMALGFTSILTVIMNLMLTVLKRRIRSVLCDFIGFYLV